MEKKENALQKGGAWSGRDFSGLGYAWPESPVPQRSARSLLDFLVPLVPYRASLGTRFWNDVLTRLTKNLTPFKQTEPNKLWQQLAQQTKKGGPIESCRPSWLYFSDRPCRAPWNMRPNQPLRKLASSRVV